MASIIGVVIICVSMVAAVATVATRRRRRVPPASWAALRGQCLVQVGPIFCTLSAREKGIGLVRILQILMFPIGSKECAQLLADLRLGVRIFRNNVGCSNAIKQLGLEALTECSFVLRVAGLCELVKHHLES